MTNNVYEKLVNEFMAKSLKSLRKIQAKRNSTRQ